MDHENLEMEKHLNELRDRIYVNIDLKQELRKNFVRTPKSWLKKIRPGLAAAVICFMLLGAALIILPGGGYVSAASLKIGSYENLLNLGREINVKNSEYGGIVYLPGPDKGMLAYSGAGTKAIYENGRNLSDLAVSRDGAKLAFIEEGSLKVYDLTTEEVQELQKSNPGKVLFAQPSWQDDNNAILYTQITLEKNQYDEIMPKTQEIFSYDLRLGQSIKLAEGTNPTFIPGQDAIIYERQEKLYTLSLKDQSEKLLGEGSYPSVSPDGNYLAFTKTDFTVRTLKDNLVVEEILQNIWIADIQDFSVRQQVTANIPLKFIKEDDWLRSLKDSSFPQALSYSGRYFYLYPSWSSDSTSLYALRRTYPSPDQPRGTIQSDLIRIGLEKTQPTWREAVKQSLQAQASGNLDYRHLLAGLSTEQDLAGKEEIIGYKLLDSYEKQDTVVAEVYTRLSEGSEVKMQKIRYSRSWESGVEISFSAEVLTELIFRTDGRNVFQISGEEGEKLILSLQDLEPLPDTGLRISQLGFSAARNTIFLALAPNNPATGSVFLAEVDLSTKQVTWIEPIQLSSGQIIGITYLSAHPSEAYWAVTIKLDRQSSSKDISQTIVYDPVKNTTTNLTEIYAGNQIDSMAAAYWDEDILAVKGSSQGLQFLDLRYNPGEP